MKIKKADEHMPDMFDKTWLMRYEFSAQPRHYKEDDTCGWVFLFFPKELSKEIRTHHKWMEEGWGRMKATVQVGNSEWKTSIWFDKKNGTHILPLKAEIRKREIIGMDNEIQVIIWV
jgi:hypothetical protein